MKNYDLFKYLQLFQSAVLIIWWQLIHSFFKDFCAYVTQNAPKEKHVIAANEGNAVAIATGYHLATGKHPMVYLQVFFT